MPLVFLFQQASEVKISRKIKKAVPLGAKLPLNISLGKLCFIRVAIIFVCPDSGFVLMAYSNNNGHNKNVFVWLGQSNELWLLHILVFYVLYKFSAGAASSYFKQFLRYKEFVSAVASKWLWKAELMSHNASRGSKLSMNELNSCLFWLFWHNLPVDWSVTVTTPKKRSLFTERFLMYTEAGISSSVPQHTAGWKVAETVLLLFCFPVVIGRLYFL